MVTSIWDLVIAGSPAYIMARRLALLRNRLKAWCLDRKLFWGINWKKLLDNLQESACNIGSLQEGMFFTQQHRIMRQETSIAYAYWRQRLKINYIQSDDLPSKLLFRRLRPRNQQNSIHMLHRSDGEWINSPSDIEAHITHHFSSLFTSTGAMASSLPDNGEAVNLVLRELSLPHLTINDIENLMLPLAREEVHQALFSLPNDKSAGPDGFNVEFFKLHWEKVGDDVFSIVHYFFATGHLLKEWKRTLLVLIPKITLPTEVNHLRPISLCNVLYKCIAKCMVNRLKRLIPSLIADNQTAFVLGRYMDDNILVAHELTHFINKQRSGNNHLAALKLDMNKAYDRVSWAFLLKILQAYGFPVHWIKMIQ